MSKAPSAETQLRTLKRLLSDARKERDEMCHSHNLWRQRAIKSEAEVCEWKARFDELIKFKPKQFDAPSLQEGHPHELGATTKCGPDNEFSTIKNRTTP